MAPLGGAGNCVCITMAKSRRKTRNTLTKLQIQADRARKMALECGSPLVSELFEIHAAVCDQRALAKAMKGKRRSSPAMPTREESANCFARKCGKFPM